ncbi:MAG: hypothetical protein AAF544_09130 [Bacteroidota bacterium]
MKYLSIILMFFAVQTYAQDNIDEQILTAYIENDVSAWDDILGQLQETAESTDDQLRLGHAAYTAVGTAFGERDMEMAGRYLDIAESALEAVLEANDEHGAAHGLLSGVMGMRIAIDESQAMRLGMASNRHARKAMKYGEEDPVALAMSASQQIYTPRQWGGDPEQGLAYASQSVTIFEEMEAPEKNWRYFEALILQAEGYKATDQKDAARATYLKSLSLQPEFAYVKYYLLPGLDQE